MRRTALGLLVALVTAGCELLSPTEVPTPVPPIPVAEATPAVEPEPTGPPTVQIVTPVTAGVPVSFTTEIVAFDPTMDVLPGSWSPDGKSLVAYVVNPEDQDGTGMWINGHLWTVDTDRAEPLWESGDMQGPVPDERMAEWRADGTLVLARADGMLVRPDGSEAGEVAGIDLQVREVDVAPDGVTVFANGPEGSWLVDGSGTARGARRPTGRPSAIIRRGSVRTDWHHEVSGG